MQKKKQSHPVIVIKPSDRISISCHPAAKEAWSCWQDIRRQSLVKDLPQNLIELLQPVDPLWVTKSGSQKGHYHFFVGFAFSEAIKKQRISSVTLHIYDAMPDEKIRDYAEGYVLGSLVSNLDRETGLGSLYNAVNKNLSFIKIKALFGRRRLSKNQLGKLTQLKESKIKWEVDKITDELSEEKSILDEVLEKG